MESGGRLELFFSQSLDGFFFMMLDEPIEWNDQADKEAVLDYVVRAPAGRAKSTTRCWRSTGVRARTSWVHRRPTSSPTTSVRGREAWREMFDRGHLHVKTHERRVDGTPIDIEGDYICLYDDDRRIIGHFGIQRDVTEAGAPAAGGGPARRRSSRPRCAPRTADLRRSEGRVRAIVNARARPAVRDRPGRPLLEIVTENPRLLFRDAHDMLGRTFGDVLPAAGREICCSTRPEDGGHRQESDRRVRARGPVGAPVVRGPHVAAAIRARELRRTSSSSPATSPTASEPPSWKARTSTCRRPSTRTSTSARSWADPRRCSRCSGDCARGGHRLVGPGAGRDRNRQGADRARDPPRQPPAAEP